MFIDMYPRGCWLTENEVFYTGIHVLEINFSYNLSK